MYTHVCTLNIIYTETERALITITTKPLSNTDNGIYMQLNNLPHFNSFNPLKDYNALRYD